MAFVNRRGKELVIALSRKESAESGLQDGKRYDVVKQGGGKWLLVENKAAGTGGGKPAGSAAKGGVKEGPKAEVKEGKEAVKESEKQGAAKKPIEEYSLEKDGFLVCKNEQRAKALSQQFQKEIEEGGIKGIKNFEGVFYIIGGLLYHKHRGKALAAIKESQEVDLGRLCEKMKVSRLLAKIVCEFLKEEGEIIEKRKELFKAVE